MDPEIALVSRMVHVAGVDQVVAAGIEPQHFHDVECRAVYQSCIDHVRTWRSSPSVDVIERRHPDFKLQVVYDELEYLIKEFRDSCAYKVGLEKWRDIGKMLDQATPGDVEYDPDAKSRIAELFMEHAREMAILIPIPRMSRFSEMSQRVMAMKAQQAAGALPGVKLGIPVLDPWIYVVRDSEFVVHAAYSGHGKTTGEVRSAIQSYQEGDTPMFISLEMEGDEIWEMFDAHAAGLSRRAINRRELGEDDWAAYDQAAQRVAAASNDIMVFDDLPGGATIDKVASLVERFGPKTVCVDYISLMKPMLKSTAKWEAVAEISQALKQLARSYKIKVYAAAQSGRDAAVNGPTEDNIAHSNTIFHDCNIMVGYWQDKEMEKKKQVQVRGVKIRGGAKPTEHLLEYWDRDNMIFEEWTREHEWRIKIEQPAA